MLINPIGEEAGARARDVFVKDERLVIAAAADVRDRLFRILRAPILRERRSVRALHGGSGVAQRACQIGRRVDAEIRPERDLVGVDVGAEEPAAWRTQSRSVAGGTGT